MKTSPLPTALCLLLLGGFVCLPAAAQSPPAQPAGIDVPIIMGLDMGDCLSLSEDTLVLNDAATFNKLIADDPAGRCVAAKQLSIDFTNYTALSLNIFADCHASIDLQISRDDARRLYEVTIFDKDGGCRGMSLFNRFVLIKKILPDYGVTFHRLRLDKTSRP